MRIESLIVLLLIAACSSCTGDQDAEAAAEARRSEKPAGLHGYSTGAQKDPFEFDIVQSTCALYVAVRSGALEGAIAFGRDLDDVPIHWNMCSGGKMIACASAPAVGGDTSRVGIPWPY